MLCLPQPHPGSPAMRPAHLLASNSHPSQTPWDPITPSPGLCFLAPPPPRRSPSSAPRTLWSPPSQLLIKPQECAPGQAPASAQAPLSMSQRTCIPKQALSSRWLLPCSLRRTHPPGKLATGHHNRLPPFWNRGSPHSHKEEEQSESLPSGQKCPFAFGPLSAVLGMQCASSGLRASVYRAGQHARPWSHRHQQLYHHL